MLYFGYGSNLCAADLAAWCHERGLPPIRLTRAGAAFLPDRRLAFTHRSTTRDGGVLDIPEARGCAVAGVLFRGVSADERATLDRKEGDGHAYERVELVALTDDGAEVPVFTYQVIPEHRNAFVAPTRAYVDVVRRGLAEHGLATDVLDAIARDISHSGPIDRIFVYGTLRRGEARHHALTRHGARGGERGVTLGRLLDLGSYPGLVLDDPQRTVAGEIYATPDPDALFADLDAIEAFRGFGVPGSLYRRAIVLVRPDDGDMAPTWTYVYGGPRDGSRVIASGDWLDRERP